MTVIVTNRFKFHLRTTPGTIEETEEKSSTVSWQNFEDYRKCRTSVWKVTVAENVFECNCPEFLKSCRYVQTLAWPWNTLESQNLHPAKTVPLGLKRKRGRPKMARPALVRQWHKRQRRLLALHHLTRVKISAQVVWQWHSRSRSCVIYSGWKMTIWALFRTLFVNFFADAFIFLVDYLIFWCVIFLLISLLFLEISFIFLANEWIFLPKHFCWSHLFFWSIHLFFWPFNYVPNT